LDHFVFSVEPELVPAKHLWSYTSMPFGFTQYWNGILSC
jgi:hypothetical protein